MGFVIVMVMSVYLLLAIGVVGWAINHAKKHGKSVIRWGLGAALVMYLIPFWDWVPTVAVHQYYCAKESGFWVYKTLDQWKAENPGVMEGMVANKGAPSTRQGDKPNFTDTYFLNQRINKIVQEKRVSSVLHIFRHEEAVVDGKTNEVLARYVNFGAGYPNGLALGGPPNAGLSVGKFWLASARCSDSGAHNDARFYEFKHQFLGRQQ